MNSKKKLLHRLAVQNLSSNQRAQLRCQLARKSEDEGDYEGARKAMGELWRQVGEPPLLDELDDETKGTVLLRAGVLTGWIGSARQISGAQETAKNLITESMAIFEALHENSRVAEAQIDLAWCYWREGAFDDGRVWLREALSRLTDSDIELRAKALLRSAVIDKDANRYNEALKIHNEAAPLFQQIENHCLRGSFHNEFATVLKNLGAAENRPDYIDRALIEYAAAAYHFERAGHVRYQACVENNLAMLFYKAQRFADAHEHLDRAQKLFARLKDDVHRAQVEETRARMRLAEGRVAEAAKAARRAVQILELGDQYSLLAEALTTLGISLARLQWFEQARSALERAINTAQRSGDVESAGKAALTLLEQLGSRLSNNDLAETVARAGALLEKTPDISVALWLADSACRVVSVIHGVPSFPPSLARGNVSFKKEVRRYEKHLIALALKQRDGSITNAARLLDLSHQAVSSRVAQDDELTKLRKPIKKRGARVSTVAHPAGNSHTEVDKKAGTVTILVAEDNQMLADSIKETLEREGWTVETCSDGVAALEKLAGDAHYDLLLLDYGLPGLNGIELIERARKLAHRCRTPIVVLSGTHVEAAARKAGANKFLPKPLGVSSLVETITRLLSEAEQQEVGGA